MEALDRPVRTDELELRFLLDWEGRAGGAARRQAWVASALLHVVGLALLVWAPAQVIQTAPRVLAAELRQPTPLVAPPSELTQKQPNRGKIGREFDMESLLPRPAIRIPPAPPSATRPAAVVPAVPEPPKIEGSAAMPASQLPPGIAAAVPPPQIQPEERPKLALETPGAPAPPGITGRVTVPGSSVSEAVRGAARSRSGGLIVGDLGEGIGGIGEGLSLPPSPPRSGSSLELLSDPRGVDFKPYLIRILSAVRRNWLAVIPEAARLGRRGRVVIQFAISRDGRVPKLIIAWPSGTDALDRAAVAGISASNPLPPLPSEFRGENIRLQFTFLYNLPAN